MPESPSYAEIRSNAKAHRPLLLVIIAFAVVMVLASHKFDSDLRRYNRSCALINSAQEGDIYGVKMFIRQGVDLTLKDSHGKTALMYAEEKHYQDIVALLQKHHVGKRNELGKVRERVTSEGRNNAD